MKKIFFNDRFGLTQAVLEGRKTMTRRIIPVEWVEGFESENGKPPSLNDTPILIGLPKYNEGEIVAIAQSYEDVFLTNKHWLEESCAANEIFVDYLRDEAGWGNKMFVKPYYMPHQIYIKNIKVERLQDISKEDCLKEGIEFAPNGRYYVNYDIVTHNRRWLERDIKSSFARLIDSISGKGTWESNPYVFVYSFELVK